MSNEGDEPAGEVLWQQGREKYEDLATDLKSIAESLGINRSKLIVEARKRGWKLRGARKNSGTRATSPPLSQGRGKRGINHSCSKN